MALDLAQIKKERDTIASLAFINDAYFAKREVTIEKNLHNLYLEIGEYIKDIDDQFLDDIFSYILKEAPADEPNIKFTVTLLIPHMKYTYKHKTDGKLYENCNLMNSCAEIKFGNLQRSTFALKNTKIYEYSIDYVDSPEFTRDQEVLEKYLTKFRVNMPACLDNNLWFTLRFPKTLNNWLENISGFFDQRFSDYADANKISISYEPPYVDVTEDTYTNVQYSFIIKNPFYNN